LGYHNNPAIQTVHVSLPATCGTTELLLQVERLVRRPLWRLGRLDPIEREPPKA